MLVLQTCVMRCWIQGCRSFFDPTPLSRENLKNMPKRIYCFKNTVIWPVFGHFHGPVASDWKKKDIPLFSISWNKFRVPTCHTFQKLFVSLHEGQGDPKTKCRQVKIIKFGKTENILMLFVVIVNWKQHVLFILDKECS